MAERQRKKRARGEGTLYHDEARGLWVGQLPRDVSPSRAKVYGATQAEARARLRRAVRDAERGLRVLNENTRLGDYLDGAWLDVVRARVEAGKLAPSTAVGYERAVRLHLGPRLGRVPLRKLTSGSVEAMFGALLAEGYAPGTVRHVRATLSRALSDAMRDDLVLRNVARLAEPPPLVKRRTSAFSVEEFRRIAVVCAEDRLGRLFLFAALTGCRRSEVLGLRWRDLDLDGAKTIEIAGGLHHISRVSERVTGRTGLVFSRPKTEGSGDPVPLSRQAVELLREQHKRQAAERLRCPLPWPHEPADTHVFSSAVGTALHPSNVSRAWRRILERADVAHLTPDGRPRGTHELRRTFVTRLRDRGIPLEDVAQLGRWASTKMILEVYSASDDERLRRAADAVGEAMSE